MKAKSFKKFFASIALSAVLTFSTAATAFAATAQLMPVEQSAELSQEQTDTPSVDDSDAQATGASYLTSQAGIAQIAASESSVTVQWTPVTNAAKYAISISPFSSGSYKLLGYFDNSRKDQQIKSRLSLQSKDYSFNFIRNIDFITHRRMHNPLLPRNCQNLLRIRRWLYL